MSKDPRDSKLQTGVRNLDALFGGGIPTGSVVVVAGPPGAGKTILTQQLCFHNATPARPALYFSTLSEPTAKTLRYLKPFRFFDAAKLDGAVQFVDLGDLVRAQGLEATSQLIMERVRQVKPAIVVIDSFKVFDDLARSKDELRKFGYELAVHLMAWETTTFLLGEYGELDVHTNPLFSVADGLVLVTQRQESGEQQRFLQIVKLRGANHNRDEHAFLITGEGVEVFSPRVTIQREDRGPGADRLKTGVSRLDDLLGDGIPRGSSVLVCGVAGTGKTLLLLEFLYRGALAGEKGIIFSFEETRERLLASARGLGWDLEAQIARGMLEIVFIPQPDILVEKHLLMMKERIEAAGIRRVAVDSVSVFLHKIKDPQIAREKLFQLASIIQNHEAVGFLATDIPYGSSQVSRFGVEETVVDGIVLLTSTEEGFERHRYLEVYKLRNTAHLKGRHNMVIGAGGLTVFPRYNAESEPNQPPPAVDLSRRLSSGVPELDRLFGGGLLERSVTLLSGSAGIGKTTLGVQFIVEGAQHGEPGLFVSLEEGPEQILNTAAALGLPLKETVDGGLVELLYLSRQQVRASQFLAILDERIRARKVRRLVLDGLAHIVVDGQFPDALRQLLFAVVTRFKVRGVTSILTFEASTLYATGAVTDYGFSPVADNLVQLRYLATPEGNVPTVSVVKTRGSAHDRGTYTFAIEEGGLRLGERIGGRAGEASPERTGKRAKR